MHHLANAGTVLNVLRDNHTKIVSINSVDLVDGHKKVTLALVWTIISRWNRCWKDISGAGTSHNTMDKKLLAWCQDSAAAAFPDVKVTNFTTSFADGTALAAILCYFRPGVVDLDLLAGKTDRLARLEYVFRLYEEAGVPALLDPEDLAGACPDRKSVMTFLICAFQVLDTGKPPPPPAISSTCADAMPGKFQFYSAKLTHLSKTQEKYSTVNCHILGQFDRLWAVFFLPQFAQP